MIKNKYGKILLLVLRVLGGLILIYFGLNNIFHWIPAPPSTGEAAAFGMALRNVGYIFPIVNTIFLLSGMSLLFNIWVPFFMILLAPITVNIFLFHIFLTTMSLPALVVLFINLLGTFLNLENFKSLFAFGKFNK